jgi:hypothetical protein
VRGRSVVTLSAAAKALDACHTDDVDVWDGMRGPKATGTRSQLRGKIWSMRGTVLRGDWLRLRRRGDRVWIRVRPFELLWHTTHAFVVDDIRRIEIQPIEPERRRRRRVAMGRARTRRVKAAVTRLTIQYSEEEVSVELNETEAAIAGVFQDLADRLAAEGGWRQGRNAGRGVRVQQGDEELEPIRWSLAPDSGRNSDLDRDLRSSRESGDRLRPEPAGDVLFTLDLGEGPPDVGRQFDDSPDQARSPSMPTDDVLFPQDEPAVEARHGVWVRKRRSRTPRLFGHRSS